MKRTTVFIIVDAGRADYVRPETMPFVHGLADGARTARFESPPGFAQRTILFSGRYPDTSGNFSAFVYDPENSPFKWVRKLGPLRAVVRPRKFLFPTRWAIRHATRALTGAYHTDPAWIPPKFLPFFRPCEDMRPLYEPGALGAASIFDLCREHGKEFRYLAHPVSGDDDEVHKMLVRSLRGGDDVDLYVAQFSVTDEMGHHHGPFSDAMQKGFLRELDDKIAGIHAALSTHYDEWNLFLCGDHGMAPVEREIDARGIIAGADAKPGKDYVVFINSTIAVLWYLTPHGRTEVEKVLPDIEGSDILDDDDRRRLRIPTDRQWGDRMVAARPGIMYWPDYFHVTDHSIVGMHGYLDKSGESYGMGVLASESDRLGKDDVGLHSLVDVFPTLCEMLGLPVPETNEGHSLLARPPLVKTR